MDIKEMKEKIEKVFGSSTGLIGHQNLILSMTGQKCDVTFFRKNQQLM